MFCLGSGGPPNDRSGDFIVQEDTIFVSGMSTNTSEADIEQHFGSIGIIKVIYLTCVRYITHFFILISILFYFRLIKKLESPKFGCTMIKQLEDLKEKQLLHTMMLILQIVLYPGLMVCIKLQLKNIY